MLRESVIAQWVELVEDRVLADELATLRQPGNEDALEDAFFQDLEFGTAGLRGVVGCGTNRMNLYTVGKATQGFADYLNSIAKDRRARVAIARDNRHGGEEFVRHSASVLAANGIEVFIYPRIEPTPALSFAVRHLRCDGGICMTASHNPAPYNGYKVYDAHGCQITSEAAADISSRIRDPDPLGGVKLMAFEDAVESGLVHWIEDEVVDAFIDAVRACSVSDASACQAHLKAVYTPLNGTGLECCTRILSEEGFEDIVLVESQVAPDGDFPTCPYPNPEERAALAEALSVATEADADIVMATDPDADRIGVAVKQGGEYALLSGNEIGILMLDYVLNQRKANQTMPDDPIVVSTIVSTQMIDAIAQENGAQVRRVLTGFKYIGNIITELEAAGEQDRFILGFEESYGYLTGSHVRDKDAVNAALIVCQMAQHHKAHGRTLVDAIAALYERYGYYANRTINVQFPGADGAEKMSNLLTGLRKDALTSIAGMQVSSSLDYQDGVGDLPAANVLEYVLGDGIKVIFRPSGTEPKLKAYLFARADTHQRAQDMLDDLETDVRRIIETR